MKYLKYSVIILSLVLMAASVPYLSAKHKTKRHSFFGLNFNVGSYPRVVHYAPAPVPVPVVAPAPVAVYPVPVRSVQPVPVAAVEPAPVAMHPVPVPTMAAYTSRAYIQPTHYTTPGRIYVQPQFSFWTYR
ncbi:MAG: hypothetical protein LW832_07795 [Parachlamydia sp.]|jgi:hypothetical protein|nr:hypothetical protein [Parachlamydia sp.]